MALSRGSPGLATTADNRSRLDEWLSRLISRVDNAPREIRATVAALSRLVERTEDLKTLADAMFAQRNASLTNSRGTSYPRVRDWFHLMLLLDAVVEMAPVFEPDGFVGLLPVFSLLNWCLCTPAGARLFVDQRVNEALRAVLDDWAAVLVSEASCYVLSDDSNGWFGEPALRQMPDFVDTFVCDPNALRYGYRSWDDFFTRRLRAGARPVAFPEDDSIVVNACEAAPYRIATGVARHDEFRIKDHPYSLADMLADDTLADLFEGGTVYQGLLSATNYHRWHSPINGRVISARVQQGLYFWIDPDALTSMPTAIESQSYRAQLSTRAVIAIESDNPAIGLMCVVPIGMVECATCEVTVAAGDQVKKGEELGMFHFGGSTHCLIFRPGVRLEFDLHGQTPGPDASDILVNASIARVLPII